MQRFAWRVLGVKLEALRLLSVQGLRSTAQRHATPVARGHHEDLPTSQILQVVSIPLASPVLAAPLPIEWSWTALNPAS